MLAKHFTTELHPEAHKFLFLKPSPNTQALPLPPGPVLYEQQLSILQLVQLFTQGKHL